MAREAGPTLDRLSSIREDGSRIHIQPADVKGRFVRRRRIVYALLIAIYVALPFVRIGGNPALLLDIQNRRFFLFGATFNAQDAWLLFFLLMTIGFGLLFFTAWLGRVWCGWACPQTVFLEGVYRRIERFFEGPREKRIRMSQGPMTAGVFARKAGKHLAYAIVSLALAHVFISFFVSLPALARMVRSDPREHWIAFLWVMSVAALLHFNFAWFREQLCIVVCPYGRLQSAMQDRHSLVIGYDVARGEPRGKLTRAERSARSVALTQVPPDAGPVAAARTKGDCIDCRRCVVVCPTGIDIRNGLQMECIGCAQCIDACDEVMDRIGRPRGLIRYDSLAGLAGEKRRVLRPRLFAYGGALAAVATALVVGSTVGRNPFEANLIRVRGAPWVVDGTKIRNQYELHLVNKNAGPTTFAIEVNVPEGVEVVVPNRAVELGSLESFRLPIFVSMERDAFRRPFPVEVEVRDAASAREKDVSARFLGPVSPAEVIR